MKVSELKLPPAVLQRFKDIAGTRYNKKTDVLKLTSKTFDTKRQNKAHIVKKFQRLVSEAWKADVNFVCREEMLPHVRYEDEALQQEMKEAIDEQYKLKKAAPHWVLYDLPGTFPKTASTVNITGQFSDDVKAALQEPKRDAQWIRNLL